MKTSIFISSLAFPFCSFSKQDKKDNQDHGIGIGIKAGINFVNITNASSINRSSQTGPKSAGNETVFSVQKSGSDTLFLIPDNKLIPGE